MFLTGNPPTIFPKSRSLNPNASFKEKGISKIAKDTAQIMSGKWSYFLHLLTAEIKSVLFDM